MGRRQKPPVTQQPCSPSQYFVAKSLHIILRGIRGAAIDCINHRVGRVQSFFSSRRNWDSPNPSPLTRRRVCPPSWFPGEGHAGERGGGRVPIPTRGPTLWYSLYIYVLSGIHHLYRTVHHKIKKTVLWVKVLFDEVFIGMQHELGLDFC
jgi:hypothetical protein